MIPFMKNGKSGIMMQGKLEIIPAPKWCPLKVVEIHYPKYFDVNIESDVQHPVVVVVDTNSKNQLH